LTDLARTSADLHHHLSWLHRYHLEHSLRHRTVDPCG
jgi:hypothetical protein